MRRADAKLQALVCSSGERHFTVIPRDEAVRMANVRVIEGTPTCQACHSTSCTHVAIIRELAGARRLPGPGHFTRVGYTLERTPAAAEASS